MTPTRLPDDGLCTCGHGRFVRALRVRGWWKQIVDATGEVVDTDLDSVLYGPNPKNVRCTACNKRWRHP